MNILESIALGLIQGLTEFLPISSSGHLIIARGIFGIEIENSLYFDIFLNTATLLAVVYCLRSEIKNLIKDFLTSGFSSRSKNLIYGLILGSIPAAVFGFLYKDKIENTFRNPESVAGALVVGSIIMFFADMKKASGGPTPLKGLVVGLFQALALIPGISRSGSSISGGIFAGLSREEAIRFSFLLLIPVSMGALLKVILDFNSANISIFASFNLQLFLAFVAALISGIWAVRFLLRYLSKNSFTLFIIYRVILAIIILIL